MHDAPMRSLGLLALVPLSGLAHDDAHLHFDPAADSVALKTFHSTMELEGGELEATMNGEPVPSEFLPTLELLIQSESSVTLRDRYVESSGGRPGVLERTFVETDQQLEQEQTMVMEGSDMSEDSSSTGTSDLEGETVRFRWDPEEGDYRAEADDLRDPDLLEGLEEDADLRAWLPEGPVGTGDCWTVPADAFACLWSPGGDLAWDHSDERVNGHEPEELIYDGEIELSLSGVHGSDGERVAHVAVEGEITITSVSASDLEEIPVVDGPGTATQIHAMTLEGELLWSLGANRVAGAEIEAEVEAEVTLATEDGAPMPFSSTVRLAGSAHYELTVDAE